MGRFDGQVAVLTAAVPGRAARLVADLTVESDVDGYRRTAAAGFGAAGRWDTAAGDKVCYGAR
jgi:hypothetical protein